MRTGNFREDLLYRLDVVTIEVPALRHRRDDIPVLAERFLARSLARYPQSPVERFTPEAMAKLMQHSWPGNVRELTHAIEKAVACSPIGALFSGPSNDILPIRELQKRYAAWALERLGGHKARTAEALGVDVKTLTKWLNEDTN